MVQNGTTNWNKCSCKHNLLIEFENCHNLPLPCQKFKKVIKKYGVCHTALTYYCHKCHYGDKVALLKVMFNHSKLNSVHNRGVNGRIPSRNDIVDCAGIAKSCHVSWKAHFKAITKSSFQIAVFPRFFLTLLVVPTLAFLLLPRKRRSSSEFASRKLNNLLLPSRNLNCGVHKRRASNLSQRYYKLFLSDIVV